MVVVSDHAPIPNDATVEWLLEGDDPSVRFFTLTGLVGKPAGDAEPRRHGAPS